ncbi:YybH family protein [Kangiella aquimarina]|uniref:Nuclear transport factor 2 family protein n=1 Tax=Kangiella aquimarina TaxID=261965 RepID=A0ABZ0X1I0_9GAMM|nr:nuclear transport factor 2 family protein [Kangiella aquimarina]WQG84442.1 nuclear transport factor 2 family protein [Kangiella aquimarina]
MKIINLSLAVLLISLNIVFSAQAHDPKEYMREAKKPDCTAMKNMDHSKMDVKGPVMQAMMKQCMNEVHQNDGSHKGKSHGTDDEKKQQHSTDADDQHMTMESKESKTVHALMSGLKTEPAKVVKEFHDAIRNGDGRLARSLLTDQVTIFEAGRVERSADEYAKHHMLSDIKFLKKMNIELLEHQVQVIGNAAISISRSRIIGKYDGKDKNNEGMETMVLEKQGSDWKIKHIHWSR